MSRFAFLLAVLLLISSCGKTVEKQIRDQIRTSDNARLDKRAVEVGEVRESGDEAIAEVTIKTAVKMRKEGDHWILEEVRVGDRRWEKVDRILKALNQQRSRETERNLVQIGNAIQAFARARGHVPRVDGFTELIDVLAPEYLPSVIRLDSWWNPFSYLSSNSEEFELRSAGPDEALGTPDDLVLRNE